MTLQEEKKLPEKDTRKDGNEMRTQPRNKIYYQNGVQFPEGSIVSDEMKSVLRQMLVIDKEKRPTV